MIYLYLKAAHIVAATLFFGAGLASALTKLRADRTGDLRVMAFALRHVVWADWVFTVPAGIALPVTGLWMARLAGWPWDRGFVGVGLVLYAVAGAAWLPAAWLQIKMRRAVEAALAAEAPLDLAYARWTRWWALLGAPAFAAAALTLYVMVAKRLPWA